MIEIREKSELRNILKDVRKTGRTIGLVPTMGYFHDGHLSLVNHCVDECDYSVVSIYVNPTQFGPNEDLEEYPRDYERDKQLLIHAGADLIYYPALDSMYKSDHSIWIDEENISKILCGKSRDNHFRGVLTVVAKLFNLVMPDKTYFGQKDYQQAVLIKKMIEELDFPIELVVCPIVREPDGLAMSSRNSYLDEDEHKDALILYKTLSKVKSQVNNGISDVGKLVNDAEEFLRSNSKNVELEYLEIRNTENLGEISNINAERAVALIAGRIGSTRLIDNMLLKDGE